MTKAELMKLATALSEAQIRCSAWAAVNSPMDALKRIEQDAQYKIAQSILRKASAEYEAAIADLSAADIDRIMREEAKP